MLHFLKVFFRWSGGAKLKFLKEVKMEKALVTFPFNEERMLQCSIEKKWNQNDFS